MSTIYEPIDLMELLGRVWRRRFFVAAAGVVGVIILIGASFLMPKIYRSETLLVPNDESGSSGLQGIASQYGGLASLAGIALPDIGSNREDIALEILKSRRFLGDFIERRNVLVPLMAVTGWDESSQTLKLDADIYDAANSVWLREATSRRPSKPTRQEAYEEFLDILEVRKNPGAGTVTVAVRFISPNHSRDWVAWLVEDLNSEIMTQDVQEAERAIAYLNEQISETSYTELRLLLYKLIEEQTKTIMLSKVSDDYLFEVLDPPVVPEKKHSPNRIMMGLLGGVLFGFIALSYAAFGGNAFSRRESE